MTVLVLENFAALPFYARSLRLHLARLARAIDELVSARAARAVPEWQMRQVRREINRYQRLIRAGEMRKSSSESCQMKTSTKLIRFPSETG